MKHSTIPPSLHFFCGKIAAGKSTLARKLTSEKNAVLISEDLWLSRLYPDSIHTFEDYLTCSSRLKKVLSDHIKGLLREGNSVVLDFPGNTRGQRAWFKNLYKDINANHCLHYLVRSNADCLVQLKIRNKENPEGSKFTSPEEFMMVTGYFEAPDAAEGFHIEKH